jgi:hypothetical protein
MKFRQASGKESRLSFGSYPKVSLSETRVRRDEARALQRAGKDPAPATAVADTGSLKTMPLCEKVFDRCVALTN